MLEILIYILFPALSICHVGIIYYFSKRFDFLYETLSRLLDHLEKINTRNTDLSLEVEKLKLQKNQHISNKNDIYG